jgi:hypothetical protein
MSSDDDIFDLGSPSSDDDTVVSDTKLRKKISGGVRRDSGVPVPMIANLIDFTFKVATKMLKNETFNTNARALYDIVNEGMEGHVDLRVTLYDMESTLVALHAQKRFVNVVHESIEKLGRESSESTARFAMYIDCWVDYVDFALKTKSEQYRQFAEHNGLKYHQSIIDRGVYAYISPSLALMAGNPPGDLHYKYGNISELPSKNSALVTIWITYGLQLIAEKDSRAFEDIFA